MAATSRDSQRGAATPWLIITIVSLFIVILTLGVLLTAPRGTAPTPTTVTAPQPVR